VGIPIASLASMRVRGGGPKFAKTGHLVRYEVDELKKWLAEHRVRNTADAPTPAANDVSNGPSPQRRKRDKKRTSKKTSAGTLH
jgi:hypothetical protein